MSMHFRNKELNANILLKIIDFILRGLPTVYFFYYQKYHSTFLLKHWKKTLVFN